jgi:uncharacterized protein YebE (UPF0316 family)
MDLTFIGSEMFSIAIIPLLIFLARIVDVSIGTIRIIFITKGMKYISPILGFFEVFVWLLAISQIMQNLTNIVNYVAYAGGFAMGTFVGMYIENRLSVGTMMFRIMSRMDATKLVEFLRSEGYRATHVNAEGDSGNANIIYTVVKRKDLKKVIGIIKKFNPKAFYTYEEVRSVREEGLPRLPHKKFSLHLFKFHLKRK